MVDWATVIAIITGTSISSFLNWVLNRHLFKNIERLEDKLKTKLENGNGKDVVSVKANK
jgi:hypothetical protein